jgi:hypothetical protein
MAFTGATAAPAAAPVADDAKAAHTLRWRLTETAGHDVGKSSFVGTDRVRSVRTGNIVGYDSISGRYFSRTNSARIQAAWSVKGGIVVGQVRGKFDSNHAVFRGHILKGTGKFNGAQGTIVVKLRGREGRALVRIEYVS